MTDIEEMSEEELMQLKHYWCCQTDRRDGKCMLDGKVIWEGLTSKGGSCKGCPYEIKIVGDEYPWMKQVSQLKYKDGKLWEIRKQRNE